MVEEEVHEARVKVSEWAANWSNELMYGTVKDINATIQVCTTTCKHLTCSRGSGLVEEDIRARVSVWAASGPKFFGDLEKMGTAFPD